MPHQMYYLRNHPLQVGRFRSPALAIPMLAMAIGFLLLGGFFFSVSAQQAAHQISGQVRDAENGEPLAGVTIRVKGTVVGTISDAQGQFVIHASPGDTLL